MSKFKFTISVVGFLALVCLGLVGIGPASATGGGGGGNEQENCKDRYITIVDHEAYDETVVDQEAYDETVVDEEAYDETVVDKAAHWQRYSWNGKWLWGKHKTPPFPDEHWQANVEGDPHGIGQAGAYWRDSGHHGKGDWFYLEWVEAVTHVVHHEAVTHVVHHDAVTHVVHHPAETHTIPNPHYPCHKPPRCPKGGHGGPTEAPSITGYGGGGHHQSCWVEVPAPTVTPATCTEDGSIVYPEVEHVRFKTWPEFHGAGTYKVFAFPDKGYKIKGQSKWVLEVPAATPQNCPPPPVTDESSDQKASCEIGGVQTTSVTSTTQYVWDEEASQFVPVTSSTSSSNLTPYTHEQLIDFGCIDAPKPPKKHEKTPPVPTVINAGL